MNVKRRFTTIFLIIIMFCQVRAFGTESPPPEITAEAAVLIDAKTGIVIFDKNKDVRNFPASITKILTALVALENSEMDERVYFSHDAVFSLPYNSSHIAMDEDESLTMEEALYAMLLQSANEVANAIGEHVGGSKEGFAEMMNAKAKELGAKDTHFLNPSGLHEDGHHTTAHDMALFMQEAVKNEKFTDIITTKSMKLPPTEKQPEQRPLNNTHKMIYTGNENYYEWVIGGKTGFTNEAGNTLVTFAQKGEDLLIAVILHDASAKNAYKDTAALFDYGFSMFGEVNVFDATAFSEEVEVVQEAGGELNKVGAATLYAKESLTLRLPKNLKTSDIKTKNNFDYQITAPIEKGRKIGTLSVEYRGLALGEVDVLSSDTVEALPPGPERAETGEEAAKGQGSSVTSMVIALIKAVAVGILVLIIIAVTSRVIRYNKRKKKMKLRRRQGDAYSMRNYRVYRYRDGG